MERANVSVYTYAYVHIYRGCARITEQTHIVDRQHPLSTSKKSTRIPWFISFPMSTFQPSYIKQEMRYGRLPESMSIYPYSEWLYAWREGKTIFLANKMHENVGADVTVVDMKKEKEKRAYDAEHSCIIWQCVTEHSEKIDVSAKQCCTIKFCVCLRKMPSETTILFKEAFGKEMFGDSTIR